MNKTGLKPLLRSLTSKYKNMAEPVKASFWFLLCGFLQKGISMLTTPIYTRIMTDSEYGRNSIYNSWYNVLFIFASLELAAGVFTRGLVKNEEKAEEFTSSLLSLSTVCISAFSAVYFIFHKQINEFTGLTTYLMVLMILEMWSTVAYQFWSNKERVAYRYKKLVALMVSFIILRPVAGVAAVLLADVNYQTEARATATVAVNFILFSGLYISLMKKGKVFFNKEFWKYALCFNIPLVPHYLSQIILNQSDRIMIDKLCDSSAVSYYSVAYSLAMVMQIFNSAVSSTMNPWIYRSIKNKSYKRIESVSYTILLAIAGMNFVIVAVGPELLKIMAPGSYYQAIWVIPPVTVSVYFTFLYNLFATFEYYFGKTKLVMLASTVGASANIALNYIFIPKYGFVAAGYTTLACYILFACMHYIFMVYVCKKYLNGIRIYNIKKILLNGILLVSASFVMMLLYRYIIIRYAVLLALLVIAICFKNKFIKVFKEIKKKDVPEGNGEL